MMTGPEASIRAGSGQGTGGGALSEPRVSPQGLLDFQLGALFHLEIGRELPQCPRPNYQGTWPQQQVPRASVPPTQSAPRSPSPRGFAGRGACVPWRDGDPGAPRADAAPGVTGPGAGAQISPREEGGCVFGLGSRLGNLRPVVSK